MPGTCVPRRPEGVASVLRARGHIRILIRGQERTEKAGGEFWVGAARHGGLSALGCLRTAGR